MMSAGKLNQRITFQQKVITRNGIGEEIATYADVCTVWAEAIPLRGNAFFAANQQQHTVDVRFRIRQRSGISEQQRLVWNGVAYEVNNVIPGTGPYRGFLEILAVKGIGNV